MECIEMRVREKISLIELLNALVKGGVGIEEEEEIREVLTELEEDKHVEEDREGEGEEIEEEKRECEALSERVHNLACVIEKMKNRERKRLREEELKRKKVVEERRRHLVPSHYWMERLRASLRMKGLR